MCEIARADNVGGSLSLERTFKSMISLSLISFSFFTASRSLVSDCEASAAGESELAPSPGVSVEEEYLIAILSWSGFMRSGEI